jgi:hypothetical protein
LSGLSAHPEAEKLFRNGSADIRRLPNLQSILSDTHPALHDGSAGPIGQVIENLDAIGHISRHGRSAIGEDGAAALEAEWSQDADDRRERRQAKGVPDQVGNAISRRFSLAPRVSKADNSRMSVRLEMLQVARLGPKVLGESAELVRGFLLSRQNPDGGFKDRSGRSDLYYTVFGIEGLLALQAPVPTGRLEAYLDQFGSGGNLDFVHLCCLARCRAALTPRGAARLPAEWASELAGRLETFRSEDGGYNILAQSRGGTAYACFLALAAYQDLERPMPEPLRLVQCLKFLETPDGGWANERGVKQAATNATAAAVTLLRQLSIPIAPLVGDWLLARAHADGGFLAAPGAPLPDLLSTATALHALAGLEREIAPLKERCLDFIDTLWTNEGGFHGHWGDDTLDAEYTYYGLLALGHLSF